VHTQGAADEQPLRHVCTTIAWKWAVCKRLMQKCLQVAEDDQPSSADDADDISSDGSLHSSEGYPETSPVPVPVCGGDDLTTLLAGIAGLARGQGILLEKLMFLEKSMGTVQFDMTWVRDDMKAVHQDMERFGDFVCDVQDEAMAAGRLKEQVTLEDSPRLAWKGKEHEVDFTRAPSVSTSRGEQQYGTDVVAGHNAHNNEGGNSRVETPPFLKYTDIHTNILALIETGKREWGPERDATPELGSPICQQTRVSIEDDLFFDESQQIEMSCQSTQLPRPAKTPLLWANFQTAVKDWPAPTVDITDREEGWVSTKKGRWDITEYGKDNTHTTSAQMVEVHPTLNLNLLPERLGQDEPMRGIGDVASSMCVTKQSKNGGSGTWRGTAHGRRPPAVQPRYHTSVSGAPQNKLLGCNCMPLHGSSMKMADPNVWAPVHTN
jgi:hypothetical protein